MERPEVHHRQDPNYRGSPMQAEEFINEYDMEMKDEPAEGGRDIAIRAEREEHRADVPVGPSDHDKDVPSSVAQGD